MLFWNHFRDRTGINSETKSIRIAVTIWHLLTDVSKLIGYVVTICVPAASRVSPKFSNESAEIELI